MRRYVKWLVILVVAAGGGPLIAVGSAYLPRGGGQKYLTATVSRGRVETVVNSTGTIKAVRSVTVGSFASGPLKKIYVKFNDYVKKEEVRPECVAGMAGLPGLGDIGAFRSVSVFAAFQVVYPATKLADIDPKILKAKRDGDAAALDTQKAFLKTQLARRDEVDK